MSTKVSTTVEEIRNEEEVAFSKTVPGHLVLGELSTPSSTRTVLGKFVRVMGSRAGEQLVSSLTRFRCDE